MDLRQPTRTHAYNEPSQGRNRMRHLYTALLYLATPPILLRLLWAGRRNRAYWRRWPERFGFVPEAIPAGGIWVIGGLRLRGCR